MLNPEPALPGTSASLTAPADLFERPSGVGKPAEAPVRLAGLDGLRAVAALCVVVMHVGAIWPNAPRIIGAAYLSVDFFFLLSGFVMARTYEARLRDGRISAGHFLAARYRRLWPTMAWGAAFALPFLWRDFPDLRTFFGAAIPNLLLLPTFVTPVLFALNTPAWSVFFELVANLAHGLVLHRLRTAALAVSAALSLVAVAACARHWGDLDLGSQVDTVAGGFARVAFSYALGIVLWRWHGNRAPMRVPPALAFAAMPVLFIAASTVPFEGAKFDIAFVAVGAPLILWGGLNLRLGTGWWPWLCRAAGAMSFPLYAVHYPVLLAAEAARLPLWLGPAAALAAAALVTKATGGFRHLGGR